MALRRVFLSSTFRDLVEHRKAVIEAIEGLEGYHCVQMAESSAGDWGAGYAPRE